MRIHARRIRGWRSQVVWKNYYDAPAFYPKKNLVIEYANEIPWNRPRKKVIIENVLKRRS
jgi:hypothetical protein